MPQYVKCTPLSDSLLMTSRMLQLQSVCKNSQAIDVSDKFPAAGLNLTEPTSTGIGGDMFCLFYDAKTKKISAMNGSGRSGAKCSLEATRKDIGIKDGDAGEIPLDSVHAVTIPGAAAGWVDTVERFGSGKLSLEQILTPAIELAERGFPVSELSSQMVYSFQTPSQSQLLTRDSGNQESKSS